MDFTKELAAVQKRADYDKTMALLAALKAGTVKLEQVQLTEGGWNYTPIAAGPVEQSPQKDSAATVIETELTGNV